tara:strand:+ start:1636 stop:2598 length:963 start_codon:yes stop_codon:yes gene_type:complete
LSELNNNFKSKKILIDSKNFDDAAIFKINDNKAIIQTVDFFTPIVDDPFSFGEIAAANSLSDIYAMGGKPLFALNIVSFPKNLNKNILIKILKGGESKCNEAKIPILGGHTIYDDEPKYGLVVTGEIKPNKIISNNNAKIDESIILTKPIGTGIISTGIKKGIVNKKNINSAIAIMKTLNSKSSKLMHQYNVSSATDVTGYGLIGHLIEMAKGSKLTAKINFDKIHFINGSKNLIKNGICPSGTKRNLNFYENKINFKSKLTSNQKLLLADAQTSGGLLISIPKNNVSKFLKDYNKSSLYPAVEIGYFTNFNENKFLIIE